uniref:Uncharacterized protein n=1 Tax=Anguilla anguilla TaxID=7936 RepID=A0A0E9T385_ANGAN
MRPCPIPCVQGQEVIGSRGSRGQWGGERAVLCFVRKGTGGFFSPVIRYSRRSPF